MNLTLVLVHFNLVMCSFCRDCILTSDLFRLLAKEEL